MNRTTTTAVVPGGALRVASVCIALLAIAAATSARAQDAAADTAPAVPAASGDLPAVTTSAMPNAAPNISDVAAAADQADAAPVLTVRASDDVRVASVIVHWRRAGGEWFELVLDGMAAAPGEAATYIGRLPDGVQNDGFDWWVEARDDAGAAGTIASAAQPMVVASALENARARLLASEQARAKGPPVDPVWVALALGTGIIASAGGVAFAIDWDISARRLEEYTTRAAQPGLSDARRAELVAARDGFAGSVTSDSVGAIALGATGAAALITGATLLVLDMIE